MDSSVQAYANCSTCTLVYRIPHTDISLPAPDFEVKAGSVPAPRLLNRAHTLPLVCNIPKSLFGHPENFAHRAHAPGGAPHPLGVAGRGASRGIAIRIPARRSFALDRVRGAPRRSSMMQRTTKSWTRGGVRDRRPSIPVAPEQHRRGATCRVPATRISRERSALRRKAAVFEAPPARWYACWRLATSAAHIMRRSPSRLR